MAKSTYITTIRISYSTTEWFLGVVELEELTSGDPSLFVILSFVLSSISLLFIVLMGCKVSPTSKFKLLEFGVNSLSTGVGVSSKGLFSFSSLFVFSVSVVFVEVVESTRLLSVLTFNSELEILLEPVDLLGDAFGFLAGETNLFVDFDGGGGLEGREFEGRDLEGRGLEGRDEDLWRGLDGGFVVVLKEEERGLGLESNDCDDEGGSDLVGAEEEVVVVVVVKLLLLLLLFLLLLLNDVLAVWGLVVVALVVLLLIDMFLEGVVLAVCGLAEIGEDEGYWLTRALCEPPFKVLLSIPPFGICFNLSGGTGLFNVESVYALL